MQGQSFFWANMQHCRKKRCPQKKIRLPAAQKLSRSGNLKRQQDSKQTTLSSFTWASSDDIKGCSAPLRAGRGQIQTGKRKPARGGVSSLRNPMGSYKPANINRWLVKIICDLWVHVLDWRSTTPTQNSHMYCFAWTQQGKKDAKTHRFFSRLLFFLESVWCTSFQGNSMKGSTSHWSLHT